MNQLKKITAIFFIFIVSGTIIASQKDLATIKHVNKKTSEKEIALSPPPFSEGIFPCSDCHADMKVNWRKKKLVDEHQDINFKHDEKNRWCLDCHNAKNRDKLHLASGRLISFKESYKLCGQCHGPKLRDWKNGIHGKRTGYWNGPKKYLLCVHCHDPHSPKFKPVKPKKPPVRPENLR